MNAIHKFYLTVFNLIRNNADSTEAEREKVVTLASKCNDLTCGDVSADKLLFLEKIVKHRGEVLTEDLPSDPREDFIISAFRDLSPMKNPEAMELFQAFRKACLPEEDAENIIWVRKIVRRKDNTAVLVLHVNDLDVFENMIYKRPGYGRLENGRIMYERANPCETLKLEHEEKIWRLQNLRIS
jgi:hypothetical protein